MTNVSRKMSDYCKLSRLELHVLSIVLFAVLVFVIVFADSLACDLLFNSVACETKGDRLGLQILEAKQRVDGANNGSSMPPFNLTWLKNKLPDLDMLKASRITQKFDERVREVLYDDHQQCQVQFFMIWIFPASLFGRREFSALESIFKAHPKACLIILSETLDSIQGFMLLKPLLDRGYRVAPVTPDLLYLFKNTSAEAWFNDILSGNRNPGEVPLAQNLSNLIRLVVLYKYGGVYLDTDFIVLRDFSRLRNVIGAQSADLNGNWTRLNNAVLVFDKNHPLLYEFMEEFQSTFDGNRWGHNGPYMVSRVVERLATNMMLHKYNFTVLPPMAFYPVDWNRIDGLFMRTSNPKWTKAKLRQITGGDTYGIHLWNRQSSRTKIEEGSIVATLIADHCIICQNVSSS
ncbi:lactosylceramide 4-alpha-galactosyltransferase-like [Coffea eugenioides]|uniref:lactosylceramide 4-alpha-galactosyltransferase-like n=1 Tax=Coffea eugenioides TaxID=49369 RepID=UPI000F60CCC3|nr:lactosylceramide 4-alpha-galactosyltransferase-like [Coffea eugenioides]